MVFPIWKSRVLTFAQTKNPIFQDHQTIIRCDLKIMFIFKQFMKNSIWKLKTEIC